jgi:CheY-like chemotaxis protein
MPRILLVDDDDQVRTMLRVTLERAGYEITEANNGYKALGVLRSSGVPDLIITDIVMPDMEGLEMIRQIRKDLPDVKIIAISGGGRISPDNYLNYARSFGAAFGLTKPVDRQELLDTIEKTLQGGTQDDTPS